MSSEYISKRKSIASQAVSIASFPVGMAALGGAKSVLRNHGVKNAIQSLNKEGFKALKGSLGGDTFSRGFVLANNYNEYSRLAKQARKLQNLADKGKVPLKDKIFNLFRKNKVNTEVIQNKAKEANEILKEKEALLLDGKEITKTASGVLKKGFGANVKGLMKDGFKDPMIWLFTALETIPDIKENVIPAFKEKGFLAGMKEAGKTALKTAGNVGTYVASSAIGRAIGIAVGTIICPGAGSAVGGNIGSMIAVSLGNILKGKIFKPKEEVQAQKTTTKNPYKVAPRAPKIKTAYVPRKTFIA